MLEIYNIVTIADYTAYCLANEHELLMNRLRDETSPYLLQHADNPVHWYPWGEDAFARARAEDKPILLSVGYSSCHWCHVMAHESFEHEATAAQMNADFINIKVDREERPDVDAIYMTAVQVLTRGGGWPMTVFLLPDGRPFHGGTYFPLEARYGMPSFRQLLTGIAQIYREKRDEVERVAGQLKEMLSGPGLEASYEGGKELDRALLEQAQRQISSEYDSVHGGFGGAPKFPQPMTHEFLLRAYVRTGEQTALRQVAHSLEQMARGGIYDQVGGGFARYSVDAKWLVPHFEKMLYDNAQLSRIILQSWQLTQDEIFLHIARDIYDYILREMTATDGGFFSATDADSEGVEGKFFVWEKAELEEILGEDAELVSAYWGVTEAGNFEGKNILHLPLLEDEFVKKQGIALDELRKRIAAARAKLYARRSTRIPPLLDDKIITSWNGLMLASLAEAAHVLDDERYRSAAIRAGDFLLREMRLSDGALLRTRRLGQSKIRAFLEDYACLIDGLIELYQLTFDERWYREARSLADYALEHFRGEDGGFYDSSDQHEPLVARARNLQDGAFPSANAHFARQLLRLAAYTGEARYEAAAISALNKTRAAMQQYPQAFAGSLNALETRIAGIAEVAIIGDIADVGTQQLLAVLEETYRPNLVRAVATEAAAVKSAIPLLRDRLMQDGRATAYVCRNFACRLPVTSTSALRAELNAT